MVKYPIFADFSEAYVNIFLDVSQDVGRTQVGVGPEAKASWLQDKCGFAGEDFKQGELRPGTMLNEGTFTHLSTQHIALWARLKTSMIWILVLF